MERPAKVAGTRRGFPSEPPYTSTKPYAASYTTDKEKRVGTARNPAPTEEDKAGTGTRPYKNTYQTSTGKRRLFTCNSNVYFQH